MLPEKPLPTWLYVLWPAFLSAAAGEIAFFALIDPQQLYLLGEPVDWPPVAVYSTGFFLFWGLTSLSALLCLAFQQPVRQTPSLRQQPVRSGRRLRAIDGNLLRK